jgi:hypothetical protein
MVVYQRLHQQWKDNNHVRRVLVDNGMTGSVQVPSEIGEQRVAMDSSALSRKRGIDTLEFSTAERHWERFFLDTLDRAGSCDRPICALSEIRPDFKAENQISSADAVTSVTDGLASAVAFNNNVVHYFKQVRRFLRGFCVKIDRSSESESHVNPSFVEHSCEGKEENLTKTKTKQKRALQETLLERAPEGDVFNIL